MRLVAVISKTVQELESRRGMGSPPPLAIVLVLDIERGLGMQFRNNPKARIDGTPNALGEAFLEDDDDCEGPGT
jgi:hypothetical protein